MDDSRLGVGRKKVGEGGGGEIMTIIYCMKKIYFQ